MEKWTHDARRSVGRNKLAQFRHRGRTFAVGLPELRKLVPAYIYRPLETWFFGKVAD